MNLKIQISQILSKPGQIDFNQKQIINHIKLAKTNKIDILIFPELALTGYFCMDLFTNQNFLQQQNKALYEIILNSKNITIILGFVDFFALDSKQKNFYFNSNKQNVSKNKFEETEIFGKNKISKDIVRFMSTKKHQHLILFNSALVIRNQKIKKIIHKANLPNYDIFSEKRYFKTKSDFFLPKLYKSQAFNNHFTKKFNFSLLSLTKLYSNKTFKQKNINFGITICEDMWDENYFDKPFENLNLKNPAILVNLSHSPFWLNKEQERYFQIQKIIKNFKKPFIFANGVGSFDGYYGQVGFDGNSSIYTENADLFLKAKEFKEDIICFEAILTKNNQISLKEHKNVSNFKNDKNNSQLEFWKSKLNNTEVQNWQILQTLVVGIKEYLNKTSLKNILVGISGGIDSALVSVLATLAIKNSNLKLLGVMMPSKFTSEKSILLAKKLAINLNFNLLNFKIDSLLESYQSQFEQKEISLKQLTLENLQARIRANILMSLSNEQKALVFSTSNKTESALGYTTLYGDMSGALSPILDLDKLKVYELSLFVNNNWKFLFSYDFDISKQYLSDLKVFEPNLNDFYQEIIPNEIIKRKPTAELSKDQTDEKSLGASYNLLVPLVNEIIENPNFCVANFVLKNLSFNKEFVQKILEQVQKNEFKRRQSPPGIKITKKSFGSGRREFL
jgi:NAD+ synthase (glutamine-hydrolysing)